MIILQTVNGIDAASLASVDAWLGSRRLVPSTTYRDDGYIHRLNRALQAEMRALAACRSQMARHPQSDALARAVAEHHEAGRELVKLIIYNRGVPEDRSALSFGLTRTFIQLCGRVPSRLAERASTTTLQALERGLVAHYGRLLDEAPPRDLETLGQLKAMAEEHQASFA